MTDDYRKEQDVLFQDLDDRAQEAKRHATMKALATLGGGGIAGAEGFRKQVEKIVNPVEVDAALEKVANELLKNRPAPTV